MKYILTADNLNKNYRHSHAFTQFSPCISRREQSTALLEKTGAGKTTLIRTICGAADTDFRDLQPVWG